MAETTDKNQNKKARIEALLSQPVLARLGTAHPVTLQPHVVPVWFAWDGESLWISAFDSTRKVKDLRKNPKCSILIDTVEGENVHQAVLMEGTAELIKEPKDMLHEMTTRIYTRYLGEEGVLAPDPQSWIYDPENTLIKLTPEKTFTW